MCNQCEYYKMMTGMPRPGCPCRRTVDRYGYQTVKTTVEEEPKKEKKHVSKRYYKVVKETPAWKAGAILESDNDGGYKAINDLWDNIEDLGSYCETKKVVEESDFFERVYAMGKAHKMMFVTKEKAQELASKYFTGE